MTAPPAAIGVVLAGFSGFGSQDHQTDMYLPALRAHPSIAIVGLCAVGDGQDELDRANAAATALSLPLHRTIDDAVRATGAAAVSVCAPPASRGSVIADALALGVDVLADKPLALTVQEIDRLQSACRDTGRVLSVAHHQRFQPMLLGATPAVAAGRIGLPWNVQADFLVAGGDPVPDGELVNLGLYPIDVILALTDLDVHTVHALPVGVGSGGAGTGRAGSGDAGSRDASSAAMFVLALDHGRGMTSTITVGRTGVRAGIAPGGFALHRYRISGSHGTMVLDATRPVLAVRTAAAVDRVPAAPSSVQLWLDDWYRAVRQRSQPATSAAAAARVMRVLDAAARSLASRVPERVG